MSYQLDLVTWELTNACNLRCRHCGSACGAPASNELSTQEALEVCNQIAELNAKRVALVGGEIFLRNDWDLIAARLCELGITVGTVSNGILIDEGIAARLEHSGISSIGISIDGTKEYHNYIRGEGVYEKTISAVDLLRHRNPHLSALTVIMRDNLSQLDMLKRELIQHGVESWQIQLGIPMGNLAQQRDLVVDPQAVDTIIDFAYSENIKGDIGVFLPDGIGYYTRKEAAARGIYLQSDTLPVWSGCKAGISAVGILSNGNVVGCTTMHDSFFVEGNLHNRSLKDIWEDENNFEWNRNFQTCKMEGFCGTCLFAEKCHGGCTSIKFNTAGGIYGENRYCAFYVASRCSAASI